MSAEKAQTEPASKSEARRFVPGLPQPATAASTASKKRRSKKTSSLSNIDTVPLETENAPSNTMATVPEVGLFPSNGLHLNEAAPVLITEEQEEDEKRWSPVAALQKRIKFHNKKLQRIATYEADTEKLNADQQRAVTSKPGVEMVVKELQELAAAFQAEEVEDVKREERKAAAAARRTAASVSAAVKAHDKDNESHLMLLFQFLHLRSLFAPDQNGFAPPQLPPVVANATAQEYAAVMSLFEAFANGPLAGGGEDAMERVKHLSNGEHVDIIEGVSYARLKRMIADLTAPPAELAGAAEDLGPSIAAASSEDEPQSFDNKEQPFISSGGPTISFMQASDIEAPVPEQPLEPLAAAAQQDMARDIATPEADPFSKAGPAQPPSLPDPIPQQQQTLFSHSGASSNWADDDADGPVMDAEEPAWSTTSAAASAAPVVQQQQPATDGFTAAGGKRRGGAGEGRGRGGGGEGRGRGGHGRAGRSGGSGNWRGGQQGDRPPREPREAGYVPRGEREGGERPPRGEGPPRGAGAGRARGERGAGGRGRGGRGRGGGAGAPQSTAAALPAA